LPWQVRIDQVFRLSGQIYSYKAGFSYSLQKIALNGRSSEGLQRVDGPAVLFGHPDASQAEVADASEDAKSTAPARTIG